MYCVDETNLCIFVVDDDESVTRALKEGAVAFLQKPFEDQTLLDAIYFAFDQTAIGRDRCAHRQIYCKDQLDLTRFMVG